jgi:hypothetical protein
MVQPAASAGATLQAIWFAGQFRRDHADHADRLAHDSGGALGAFELERLQHDHRYLEMTDRRRRLHRTRHRRKRCAHLIGDRLRQVIHPVLAGIDYAPEQGYPLFTAGP